MILFSKGTTAILQISLIKVKAFYESTAPEEQILYTAELAADVEWFAWKKQKEQKEVYILSTAPRGVPV